MEMKDLDITDLTQATLNGTGTFDVLMRAHKAHLDEEYKKNRITGPEYSTVYLGAIEHILSTSLAFLLESQKAALEAKLIEQQVLLTQAQVQETQARVEIAHIQKDIALAELEIAQANAQKIPAEIAQIEAQTQLIEANLTKVPAEKAQIEAQTDLINQQKLNAEIEHLVLQGQKCKLDAEFDLIQQNVVKAGSEVTLLNQKTVTERAQVTAMGVDEDSVIGRQKRLYFAQTEGFKRDAEQKAAKIMVDAWNIRRSTDEGEPANETNMLDNPTIGRTVRKLLDGVGA